MATGHDPLLDGDLELAPDDAGSVVGGAGPLVAKPMPSPPPPPGLPKPKAGMPPAS
jgi:hypothetical protein